LAKLVLA